jgi:CDP-diglyceride synthetase
MRTVEGIIVAAITFAVMAAFAMLLQWINAHWSIWGTFPIGITIGIAIYLHHRHLKRQK